MPLASDALASRGGGGGAAPPPLCAEAGGGAPPLPRVLFHASVLRRLQTGHHLHCQDAPVSSGAQARYDLNRSAVLMVRLGKSAD
jgi:hypothetical protein